MSRAVWVGRFDLKSQRLAAGTWGQSSSVGRTGNLHGAPPLKFPPEGVGRGGGRLLHSTHILFYCPCHPQGGVVEKNKSSWVRNRGAVRGFSEQIRQDQAGRFWFDAVDPEIGTAGVILVSPVRQLEAVGSELNACQEETDTEGEWSGSLHTQVLTGSRTGPRSRTQRLRPDWRTHKAEQVATGIQARKSFLCR